MNRYVLNDLSEATKKELKTPLGYLKEISPLFRKGYARYGCPGPTKPVVISLPEYWKNYRKIKIKIKSWCQKLSKADQEDFPGGGEIWSHKDSLEHLQKQVKYLKGKLKSSEDNDDDLDDMVKIIERFMRGIQMKIPLEDVYYHHYSDLKFFFSPYQWCPACREPKLGSDINMKKCDKCHSNVWTISNKSYINFPKTKERAHLRCLPCCYIKSPNKIISDYYNCSHPSKPKNLIFDLKY